MWGDLFWSNEIVEEFSGLNSRKINWVMFHIEWVSISLDLWLFDLLLNAVFQLINLGLELLDRFIISLSEFQEVSVNSR